MKNTCLQLSILFLISLIFTACKKDEKTVVGTWNAKSMLKENCTDSLENGSQGLGGFECNDVNTLFCIEWVIIFNEDGTFTQTLKSLTNGVPDETSFSGNYTFVDNEIEMCIGSSCDTIATVDNTIILRTKNADTGCDSSITFEKI